MKTLSGSLLVLFVSAAAHAGGGAKQVQVPIDAAKWEQPFGPDGISTSEVAGDKKKGPYTVLMKFPAGFDSGWHTHDADYSGVVIAGTLENVEQGGEADAKPLPAGSWWSQPAKKNHVTRCAAGAECLALLSIKGGFTFHPMTPEGKPAPAPKKDDAAAKPAAPAAKKDDAAAKPAK
jgi:quercetin dioxygenase-like cupin family protein